MTDWSALLDKVAPEGDDDILAGLAAAMPAIVEKCGLKTPARIAGFLGQWCEETDG